MKKRQYIFSFSSRIPVGLEKVKSEHTKSSLPDDHAVEVMYSGPSGYGIQGKAVGCAKMLNELQATKPKCEALLNQAEALESHLTRKAMKSNSESDSALLEVLSLFQKFAFAARSPEYVYAPQVKRILLSTKTDTFATDISTWL